MTSEAACPGLRRRRHVRDLEIGGERRSVLSDADPLSGLPPAFTRPIEIGGGLAGGDVFLRVQKRVTQVQDLEPWPARDPLRPDVPALDPPHLVENGHRGVGDEIDQALRVAGLASLGNGFVRHSGIRLLAFLHWGMAPHRGYGGDSRIASPVA